MPTASARRKTPLPSPFGQSPQVTAGGIDVLGPLQDAGDDDGSVLLTEDIERIPVGRGGHTEIAPYLRCRVHQTAPVADHACRIVRNFRTGLRDQSKRIGLCCIFSLGFDQLAFGPSAVS
jgi:hypothetical protein